MSDNETENETGIATSSISTLEIDSHVYLPPHSIELTSSRILPGLTRRSTNVGFSEPITSPPRNAFVQFGRRTPPRIV